MQPPSLAPSDSNSSSHNIPFNRILSPIEHKNLKFLVLDCPTDQTVQFYVNELKSRGVTDVVRVCEPTYNKKLFEDVGIYVHDWPFKDGGIPPADLVNQFLSLCDERFVGGICASKDDLSKGGDPVIAVHCVAGLGRAPALVAIALIESGMPPLDTIEFVRKRRRGAFNNVQLSYLMDTYKRQWGKKKGKYFKRPVSPSANNPSSKDRDAGARSGSPEGQASSSSATPSSSTTKEPTSIFGRLTMKFKKTSGAAAIGIVSG